MNKKDFIIDNVRFIKNVFGLEVVVPDICGRFPFDEDIIYYITQEEYDKSDDIKRLIKNGQLVDITEKIKSMIRENNVKYSIIQDQEEKEEAQQLVKKSIRKEKEEVNIIDANTVSRALLGSDGEERLKQSMPKYRTRSRYFVDESDNEDKTESEEDLFVSVESRALADKNYDERILNNLKKLRKLSSENKDEHLKDHQHTNDNIIVNVVRDNVQDIKGDTNNDSDNQKSQTSDANANNFIVNFLINNEEE